MRGKKKLKLKKFYFHPITVFIVLSLVVVLISAILSGLEMQATYNTVNATTKELESQIVSVENMLSFDGMKFIISNATNIANTPTTIRNPFDRAMARSMNIKAIPIHPHD